MSDINSKKSKSTNKILSLASFIIKINCSLNNEYGSVVLMHLEATVPNHGGIYIDGNMILHHVQDRLSSRDLYGGFYQKNTAKILKHESH